MCGLSKGARVVLGVANHAPSLVGIDRDVFSFRLTMSWQVLGEHLIAKNHSG
jgi:hypothetical protein